jgi:hypothetical protein
MTPAGPYKKPILNKGANSAMKSFRALCCLAFAAVLAMGVVAVSAAQAEPEFKPSTKQTVTGVSGSGTLETSSGDKITCTTNKSTGEVSGTSTVSKVVVTYTGCKGKEGSGSECAVNSKTPKGGTEEIIIDTTKGTLGLVAKTEATSGVGILFKPESGSEFVDIEGSCLISAPVDGDLAGEVTPAANGKSSKTGKIVFVGSAGKQTITKITVNGKSESPELDAFSGLVKSSLNDTENTTFGTVAVEVS